MNCPYCSTNTDVTNSRGRGHKVWRRRNCREDHTFTTYETVDTAQINVRKRDKRLEPLQMSKLLLSLAQSGLSHDVAVNLEQTIQAKLMDTLATESNDRNLSSKQIATTAYQTLTAFDQRYGERYRSYSEQL